jgi:hypothetical protein
LLGHLCKGRGLVVLINAHAPSTFILLPLTAIVLDQSFAKIGAEGGDQIGR